MPGIDHRSAKRAAASRSTTPESSNWASSARLAQVAALRRSWLEKRSLGLADGRIIVATLCAGVSFLDGFDILAISYVAPVLSAAWKLPKEGFGPIFAATYIGAAAGAVFFGWYADRYGRRLGVIIPTAIFGLFALLTAYAYDFRSLAILRMLTGIGLGGALSNGVII
jgi:MFS family permease